MGIMVAKGVGKLMGGGSSGGGLGGLLGSLTGSGNASASSGLGGLLDSLGGSKSSTDNNTSGFGSLFGNALQGKEPAQVTQSSEQQAELMLRAMISAAKADGKLDESEQRKIIEI